MTSGARTGGSAPTSLSSTSSPGSKGQVKLNTSDASGGTRTQHSISSSGASSEAPEQNTNSSSTTTSAKGPSTTSTAAAGDPPANTKGYDNAGDLIQNLMGSSLMGEVHQYLATKLSTKDMSFATMDVIRNPGKYTAEQKTLMYMDLLYTRARYDGFKGEADKWRDGINNQKEIGEDFKQALAILGSDKDVQSGYVKMIMDAFKLRFNWNQLTPFENDDPLDQIEQRKKKDAAMKPTLDAVLAAFDRDIVEGGLLKKGLEAGKDAKAIMEEYNTTLGAYLSILPEQDVFGRMQQTLEPTDIPLIGGASFQERMTKAEEKYKEFFATHILPNAPNPGDGFKEIFDEQVKREFGGLGPSVLPQLDPSNISPQSVIFRNLSVDVNTLREVAKRDVAWKEGVGLKNLFRPTVEIMANLRYPDAATAGGKPDANAAAHRKAFTDAVMNQIDPLMTFMGTTQSPDAMNAYLDRLTFTPSAATGDFTKQDMVQALRGLVMGASAINTMNADATADPNYKGREIGTYSVNDISAAITIGTGLAGQSLVVAGTDGLSARDAAAMKKLFGNDDNGRGWSAAVFSAAPSTMATEFWDKSVEKMSKSVAAGLRNRTGLEDGVTDPKIFTRQSKLDAIAKIVAPSAQALAASYFKDNPEEAKTFTANMSTMLGAVWGLTKPGGDIHTLKANLTAWAETNIKSAPPSIEISRYRSMVVSGATTIVNSLRTSWLADHNPDATWDTIGLGVMHAMGGLSALLKGGSTYASKLIPHMEAMLPGEPDVINASRKALAKNLGTAAKVVGNAAGFGYAPLEIYQFAKALKDGGNPVDLALMGIGTVSDSILAVQGLAGLGEVLINSTWLNRAGPAAAAAGRAASAAAPFRFFSGLLSSTIFTAASAVSWIAWGGYAIWQLVKAEKAYNKTKDALDADMARLIGTNMSFYDIKSRDRDRNGQPYKDDNAERTLTPEDWAAIRAKVEEYRKSANWEDWKIPE